MEKTLKGMLKKKGGVLKNDTFSKLVLFRKAKSEAGNITESNSVNIKEECLVEETSVDYGKRSLFIEGNSSQTPKDPRLVTKKALDMLLEKINFLNNDDNNDIFLNIPVVLSPSLKNLVNVSVWKSFAMNIELDKMARKSFQEKLVVVRKLFSKVNGFEGVFTLSKFSEIICAFFTSESSLAQTIEKIRAANILVNTDFKKSTSHSDQTVVVKKIPVKILAKAMHTALSKFGIIKSIKMQLVGLWQKAVVKFKQSNYADLVAAE
ncbi:hypothetical protein G9A89_012227 [Geosiphon pyriformis]|nr:hypothetical protein G9A89_012227 [Geosiphon pyriformis]